MGIPGRLSHWVCHHRLTAAPGPTRSSQAQRNAANFLAYPRHTWTGAAVDDGITDRAVRGRGGRFWELDCDGCEPERGHFAGISRTRGNGLLHWPHNWETLRRASAQT